MNFYRKFTETLEQTQIYRGAPSQPPQTPKVKKPDTDGKPILGGLGTLGREGLRNEGLPPAVTRVAAAVGVDSCQDRSDDIAGGPLPGLKHLNQLKSSESWGDAEEERAAIVEYGTGLPRDWAEGFARLDPDCAPADVPQQRWRVFVDDVGRFLDGGWAEKARALGWGPIDLFGCNRERPFARIDAAGLCWFMNGTRLVALSEGAALIETHTGAHQTYRRKPVLNSETAPVWELTQ